MNCKRTVFSGHAVHRMFERNVSVDDISRVIVLGQVVADYPEDAPYPSQLLLGFLGGKPLHVVVARDKATGTCYIVTVYVPDPGLWSADFRTRRT